ncbi:MAG: nicotinate phosphoribosyltransferase [Planctomycetota bacterium]|nr:nicotinate phosphoribosyltransferase [Planctomycetota bacterium]
MMAGLALLTDLYQLTMAYGYWKLGRAHDEAVFHLTFRRNPFGNGFAIAAGLAAAADLLDEFAFTGEDTAYLAGLTGSDGAPLFDRRFLDELRATPFSCDIDAMPEGTLCFPHEPLLRVRGPLAQAQILETPLLTVVNFQTLIATKAARVCRAARGEPVIEFGLRRAQGVDGGLAASRAAFIGGCAATSNVLAGKRYGIPVRGTHAHSWVMCFDEERDAFDAYAAAMPNNCVLLVDTYDTIQGVRHAIATARRLREQGHELAGIRLDSGDLAALSRDARAMLDDAGFPDVRIVASNDLDEHAITELKESGAAIAVWGVGTKLATAYDQPALGGVYKLSALRGADGVWHDKMKLSADPIKVSNPGILNVRRLDDHDVIYDERYGGVDGGYDLLVPFYRDGRAVGGLPTAAAARAHAAAELAALPGDIQRLYDPAEYPVALEAGLAEQKRRLSTEASSAR